jgi:hypothetical protein
MRGCRSARHWRRDGTGIQSSAATPSDFRWRHPAAHLDDPAADLDNPAADLDNQTAP